MKNYTLIKLIFTGFDPKIPGYPRYSMYVKEDEGIYNLHIKNVNFQDEGEFQCQVSFNFTLKFDK